MLEHLRADAGPGRYGGGLTVYRDAMVRYPLNLGLIYGYGGALIGVRRFEESLRFAEAQLRNYPEDVRLHKMRAESYAGLGQRAMQHRALAEVFILQGRRQARSSSCSWPSGPGMPILRDVVNRRPAA